MIYPDYISPDVAFVLGLGLAVVWAGLERRAVVAARRTARYWSLDCRDGQHRACSTCNCRCHGDR
ncbi:hypothetical protein E4V99_13950 [Microbacterium sp. dk485]|uniref:hypothetical protein n=1 Tax=Microbacterium sp. dk485 TaxID=2560021 RepID=UPI0010743E30|nr:hypothetical protein [Microbacterium sp. dk485]TFV82032.1 hypothetical protein E4V99_13950 [Microbacterium sp. dk485]